MHSPSLLLLHGPNLNLLGKRSHDLYGTQTLEELEQITRIAAAKHAFSLMSYHSNYEGGLIDQLQEKSPLCSGIIINPGALTHYSYALHDAILDTTLPTVELHLSKISEREPWRRHSVIAPACITQIEGLKEKGYLLAVEKLVDYLNHNPSALAS